MTTHIKISMFLAGTVALTACGSSNNVNNAQPNPAPAVEAGAAAGQNLTETPTTGTAATATPANVNPAPGVASGPAASSSAGTRAVPGTVPPATSGPATITPAVPTTSASGASVTPSAPPAAPAELHVYRELAVPSGTRLPLELLTSVSSASSTVESPVRARVRSDVVIDGVTAIPSGSTLTGVVTEAERAGKVKGRSRLAFRFTEAEIRGTTERLRTNAVVLVGEASTKSDATKIGGGAVAGAVIGGLLGGGKGAAEGAAIGGGAGTGVVLATRGKDVSMASGASVTATLAEPLTLQVPR
jgi:hypothetical protein